MFCYNGLGTVVTMVDRITGVLLDATDPLADAVIDAVERLRTHARRAA